MTLISPSELAAVQSVAESGMTGTAMILTRVTVVTDDGQESVWATVGDEVKAWVYERTSPSGTLGAIAGAVGISEVFSVRLPVGSAVNSGDRLAVGSTIYEVQHTNSDSNYAPWLDCACRMIE